MPVEVPRRLLTTRNGPRAALLVLCGLTTLLGLGAWSDFHYYATGARQLTGPHALELYAQHPEIQIGPVALLLIRGLLTFGETPAAVTIQVVATALALVPLVASQRLDPTKRTFHWLLAIAIGLTWTQITVHEQPADALVVALLCATVVLTRASRWELAMVAVVLAAGAKPWAAPAALLLLGLPRPQRWWALGATGLSIAAVYLPFLLQPGGTHVVRPHIRVMPDAPVAWLVGSGDVAPTALRPIQLLACCVVALVLGLRGRWRSVPVGVVTIRLLLDPGALPYYHAGLVALSGLVDRHSARILAVSASWFLVASALYGLGIGAVSRTLQLALGVVVLWLLRGPQ